MLLALIAWSGFFADLEVSGQTPTPKFRRVDLGRGMWRVEPVLDASAVSAASANWARSNASDVEVARQMLVEARKLANAGKFADARQLIEWASTLDVDWETQPATPAGMMNELQVIELLRQPPQPPQRQTDDVDAESLLRTGSRKREFGSPVQGTETRSDFNVLRMASNPSPESSQPPVAGGPTNIDSVEDRATTFAGASSSADKSERNEPSQTGDPSTSKELTASSFAAADSVSESGSDIQQPAVGLDGALSGQNSEPPAGRSWMMPAETWGFWQGLAISALCGLVLIVLFASTVLRRVMLQQGDILRAMVETTERRNGPAVQAAGPLTVHHDPAPAAGPVPTLRLLSDQPAGWVKPETFNDQKKHAEERRREQNSELMRQLISSNVAIRKQVWDKRTTAA